MEKIEISPGNIALSLKGRDKGNIYLIIELINPEFVLLADGDKRKMANPKLKRVKHLKLLSKGLAGGEVVKIQDSLLVNTIKKFKGGMYA